MRILCLSWKDLDHPKSGGAEVVLHKYLAGLVYLGHEVVQIAPGFQDSSKTDSRDGVSIHRRGNIHTIYFFFVFVYIYIYAGKHDVIIDHAGGIPLMSPVYARSIPKVFLTHHVGTKERAEYFNQRIGLGWIGDICKYIYNNLVLGLYTRLPTVTVSQGTASELTRLGFQDIHVLPNTTDYPRISYTDIILPRPNHLTVVGRIVPNKQFDHAIEILYTLHQSGYIYILNIVGSEQDSTEVQKCRDLVQKHNLEDYVIFHGRVSDQELLDIWDQTMYGLMVSDKEGFGMTIIEGNCRGVPFIGYDIPGVNEVIQEGINGSLVPKNSIQAIVDCILSQDMYDGLVKNTADYISGYPTWEKNVEVLDTLLRNILVKKSKK